jgi:hypothetical protein
MSRIEAVTLHHVNDDDTDDTYQVEVLHLADGRKLGYRVDADEDGRAVEFTPVEDALVRAIVEQDDRC